MHNRSSVAVAIIAAVALYFAVAWGVEAVSALSSPAYGLDDVWRSQVFFAIGHFFGLAPIGMVKVAAFFATLKLAAAVICAWQVVARLRALISGQADTEIFEAGLILIVLISIALVGPAVWAKNAWLVRELTIQLLLAALATWLCVLERVRRADNSVIDAVVVGRETRWFTRRRGT